MRLIRMDATVGEQAEEMKLATSSAGVLHRTQQYGILKKISVLNHQLDACRIHVDDPPGTNVQVTHFAVTHLTVTQTDVRSARVYQCVGVCAQQAIVCRLSGECDGVGFGFGTITPAVEDGQNEWFRTRHKSALAVSSELSGTSYLATGLRGSTLDIGRQRK